MENSGVKSKRGGARVGAGRKREEYRRKPVNLIVSDAAAERLKAYAASVGKSASEVASELFEALTIE